MAISTILQIQILKMDFRAFRMDQHKIQCPPRVRTSSNHKSIKKTSKLNKKWNCKFKERTWKNA